MRFLGALVGLVAGAFLGVIVGSILMNSGDSHPEADLGRFFESIALSTLGCVIAGWIAAGRIQDRDGKGLGSGRSRGE